MPTERELAHELRDRCRQLLRYDGIDKERVRQAVDGIGEIIAEWEYLENSEELDCS